MSPRKQLSLNERARLLAIESLKQRAREAAGPGSAPLAAENNRSRLAKKDPGIRMTDEAAKLFAEAIRGMLKG
jgi:hypothetical protein